MGCKTRKQYTYILQEIFLFVSYLHSFVDAKERIFISTPRSNKCSLRKLSCHALNLWCRSVFAPNFSTIGALCINLVVGSKCIPILLVYGWPASQNNYQNLKLEILKLKLEEKILTGLSMDPRNI